MSVADKLRELRWRAAGHYSRPLPDAFVDPLRGAAALEIGGPSAVFGREGLLPVYPVLSTVDGLQWAAETEWHTLDGAAPYAPEGQPTGTLLIDTDGLNGFPDDQYDVVLSSHLLEHLADPLGALESWRRITRPAGHVLIVAPHMAGTFDHRRPVTTIEHLRADRDAGMGEADLTHLDETLRLHDRTRDADTRDAEAWEALRRDNLHARVLHHHVFTTMSLGAVLVEAGIEVVAAEARFPHDIYLLGRFDGDVSRSTAILREAARRSPFAADRG